MSTWLVILWGDCGLLELGIDRLLIKILGVDGFRVVILTVIFDPWFFDGETLVFTLLPWDWCQILVGDLCIHHGPRDGQEGFAGFPAEMVLLLQVRVPWFHDVCLPVLPHTHLSSGNSGVALLQKITWLYYG